MCREIARDDFGLYAERAHSKPTFHVAIGLVTSRSITYKALKFIRPFSLRYSAEIDVTLAFYRALIAVVKIDTFCAGRDLLLLTYAYVYAVIMKRDTI